MQKSTIIATCLVNLRSGIKLDAAEHIVLRTFEDEYPKHKFDTWNTEIHDDVALRIIETVGNPSRINVKNFIRDLW